MASKTHPGYIPDRDIAKDATKPSRAEVMKKASKDAGKTAEEREAARRK